MVDKKKNFEKINFGKIDTAKKLENHEKVDRSFEQEKIMESEIQKNENLVDLGASEGEGELGGIISTGNKQVKMRERQKEIEDVLSGDLGDLYLKMPDVKQKEFKKKGEEVARTLNVMLDSTKFKIKKVVELIRTWLMIIPGISKFFLEQETKIKADEILRLRNHTDINKLR